MAAALLLKQQRGLDVVGLDAADVVGFLEGGGRALATAAAAALRRGGRLLTLLARFSTSEIMEVLKSVAAVRGRLVTSVMLSLPSGHMTFSTGLELEAGATQHSRRVNDRKWRDCMFTFKLRAGRRWSVVGGAFFKCASPVVQESLEVLEQSVFVLVDEAHHRVPVETETPLSRALLPVR